MLRPFIWGVFDGSEFRHFDHFDKLMDYLQNYGRCVVYAHNGGRFDFLYDEVVAHIPSYQKIQLINGRLASFRVGDVEFRDSLCLLPIALKGYKKDDFNYSWLRPSERARHMEAIVRYLKADCVYLWELVSDFLDKYGAALTLASASLRVSRKIEGFDGPKSTRAYFEKFCLFFYGGRVESPATGRVEGPIRVWDINSAYPYAMMSDHPWGCRYVRSSHIPSDPEGPSMIIMDAESTGAFPVVTKRAGRVFPADGAVRRFYITGWEFNAAKALGLLKVRREIAYFRFLEKRNFSNYISQFYELKRSAKKGTTDYVFAKLFMNSNFGKYGQDPRRFKKYMMAPEGDIFKLKTEGWGMVRPFADGRAIYQKSIDRDDMRFYDVAVAASVTGFVRAMLLRAAATARKAGSKVLYMDTDCLHTTGRWAPKESDDLGAWKLEVVAKRGYYGGRKLYALENADAAPGAEDYWKTAIKGAKLTGEQIAQVAERKAFYVNDAGKLEEGMKYEREAPTMSLISGTKYINRVIRNTAGKAIGPLHRRHLVPISTN